jgi:hypothetical protein
MWPYTEETKPGREYTSEDDHSDLDHVYSYLRHWAAKAELNPKPSMPAGVLRRSADNVRGLFAIADSCGLEWGQRAREAAAFLFEKERAERLKVVVLRHGLVIFDMLELDRIPSIRMNKELRRLDLADANWNRYRGAGGSEYVHPLTIGEQAKLLKESGVEARVMKPAGGGKAFRGYERSWFVEALRRHEPAAAAPHLRLITPRAD